MNVYYKHANWVCFDVSPLCVSLLQRHSMLSYQEGKPTWKLQDIFSPAGIPKKMIYLKTMSHYGALVSMELSMWTRLTLAHRDPSVCED